MVLLTVFIVGWIGGSLMVCLGQGRPRKYKDGIMFFDDELNLDERER